eukprot:scaffold81601_cov19-Tisochrysis_lutea.AAC.1
MLWGQADCLNVCLPESAREEGGAIWPPTFPPASHPCPHCTIGDGVSWGKTRVCQWGIRGQSGVYSSQMLHPWSTPLVKTGDGGSPDCNRCCKHG